MVWGFRFRVQRTIQIIAFETIINPHLLRTFISYLDTWDYKLSASYLGLLFAASQVYCLGSRLLLPKGLLGMVEILHLPFAFCFLELHF